MAFHDVYTVRTGDNLGTIARSRGYDNPGPIVAYPPNRGLFPQNYTPNVVHAGLQLLIPWHPDLLRKLIATSDYLIRETATFATRLIQEQIRNKSEIDDFLLRIDALNFLTSLLAGIGYLAVVGARGAEMSSSEALTWLIDSRAGIASNITTIVVPSPTTPRRDFRYFVRHTLGPWNPSYWASVIEAYKEGDVDIYLYGTDAVAYKNSLRIKQQADRDIDQLCAKVAAARQQLGMPFYNDRI